VWPTKFPCIKYVFYLVQGEAVVPNKLRYIDISEQDEPRALTFESEKEL